jgi:hypothetical protein
VLFEAVTIALNFPSFSWRISCDIKMGLPGLEEPLRRLEAFGFYQNGIVIT